MRVLTLPDALRWATNAEAANVKIRRSFRGNWDEIPYRYAKAFYQLHTLRNRRGARPHIDRLRYLLVSTKSAEGAILGESALALVAEYDCDWRSAVHHRKREAHLTVSLYRCLSVGHDDKTVKYALQGRRKKQVLSHLKTVRSSYQRQAEHCHIQAIQGIIDLIAEAKEPKRPR